MENCLLGYTADASQGVPQDGENNRSPTHWKTRRMIRYEILRECKWLEPTTWKTMGVYCDARILTHPSQVEGRRSLPLPHSLALIWKPGQVGKPLSASLWMVNIEQRTTKINKASSTQWTLSRDRNILLYFSLLSHLTNHTPMQRDNVTGIFSDARNNINL